MNIFCEHPGNTCPDPAAPISNYSAEAPDKLRCYGRNYGTGLVPPLGSPWLAAGCVGECIVEISREDVIAFNLTCGSASVIYQTEECAQRASIECRRPEWPEPDPDGNPVPRLVFFNDAQSCDFTCPDGLIFTYTVPSGTFAAFSQAEADAIAYSVACNRAIEQRVCLSALSADSACAGQSYSGVITATGPEIPTSGNVWEIVSGSLPPGLSISSDGSASATISGTAGAEGSYTFSVRMTTPAGNAMTKTYVLCVIGKTALDDGAVGVAYSETLTDLTSAGCPDAFPLSWQVTAGALPDGLVLNEATGAITGTPTVVGTFNFTVLLQTQAS